MKQLDFDSIANRMRYRARSGEHCGDGSERERLYVKKCSVREGSTTLVFTRDFGCHTFGWLANPEHDRCWHLSIACNDPAERNAWLRAFFGEHVESLWGHSSVTLYGQSREVWHWWLFCDERWQPLLETNSADLLAARMLSPRDLGVVLTVAELAA